MKQLIRKRMLLLCCALPFSLTACGAGSVGEPIPKDPQVALSCVGVLPVTPVVDYDGTLSPAEAKVLHDGSTVLDNLVKEYFGARQDIRYATNAQIQGLDASLAGNSLEQAKVIGGYLSCNAILEITLNRYEDRVGGELSAEKPAAVGFDFRLIETGEGKMLCQSRFDEQQQSVMENLFNWGRASARGFKWVTAESLLREGIQQKFADCPYLAAP